MKQIIIAAIFFGFWGSVGGAVWLLVRAPAPAPEPSPQEARPLQVGAAYAIATPDEKYDFIGFINNPNTDAGAVRVEYAFRVMSGGEELDRIHGETYILPSRPMYVTSLGNTYSSRNIEVELEIGTYSWRFVDRDFVSPSIVSVYEIAEVLPERPDLRRPAMHNVKTLLSNESPVGYQHVDVIAIAKDAAGEIIGVGITFAGEFHSGERREVTAQWPLIPGKNIQEITWIATANVFAPEAIILFPEDTDPGVPLQPSR